MDEAMAGLTRLIARDPVCAKPIIVVGRESEFDQTPHLRRVSMSLKCLQISFVRDSFQGFSITSKKSSGFQPG